MTNDTSGQSFGGGQNMNSGTTANDQIDGCDLNPEYAQVIEAVIHRRVVGILSEMDEPVTADRVAEITGYTETHARSALNETVEAGLVIQMKSGDDVTFMLPDGINVSRYVGADTAVGAGDDFTLAAFDNIALSKTPTDDETDDEADSGTEHRDIDADQTTATDADNEYVLPVERDYDWEKSVIDDETEYYSSNGELERIEATIAAAQDPDYNSRLPRFLVSGPTGCGKTALSEHIASKNGFPFITVQISDGTEPHNLIGETRIVGKETVWEDGPITKALLASQERPVVLLLDEVNRAPPRTKDALYPVFDHRCEIRLDARGGEPVKGNPENLIVFSTMNEGSGHFVQPLDLAEKSRYGAKFEVDYLGRNDPSAEVSLMTGRSPLGSLLANDMVEAANSIRDQAADVHSSNITAGIPTRLMVQWGQEAITQDRYGTADSPIVAAGKDVIVTPFYSDNEARDVVTSTLESKFAEAPTDDDDYERWLNGEYDPDADSRDADTDADTDTGSGDDDADSSAGALGDLFSDDDMGDIDTDTDDAPIDADDGDGDGDGNGDDDTADNADDDITAGLGPVFDDVDDIEAGMESGALVSLNGVGPKTADELFDDGFETIGALVRADAEDLLSVYGVQDILAERIKEQVGNLPDGYDDADDRLYCTSCGYESSKNRASDAVLLSMECPSCGSDLQADS